MSWLDPLEPDDALATLLTDWRAELDDQVTTAMSTGLPEPPGRPRRWVRAHQRAAAATAIVVAIAGSTSVAAAASGSSGPLGGLHNWLYGAPADHPAVDHVAVQAAALLASIDARVQAAQAAGEISSSERAQLAGRLDRVETLLNGDQQAPQSLRTHLTQLRSDLAAIPAPAPQPSVAPQPAHGGNDTNVGGRDGSTDGGSHGSDDGQSSGDRQGSDDGQTSDDGQSTDRQGSNDGGDSGDQSSGTSSDDGTSGGDQSQESGHSGDSSTTAGTDQSDDGATTSGDSGTTSGDSGSGGDSATTSGDSGSDGGDSGGSGDG